MSSDQGMTSENAPKRLRRGLWLTREVIARLAAGARVGARDAGEPHTVGLRTAPPCAANDAAR